MSGNRYAYAAAQMDEHEVRHTDDHLFFDCGAVQNGLDVTAVIMTQLLLKSGLNRWGERVREEFNSEMKQLRMRETFIPLNRN